MKLEYVKKAFEEKMEDYSEFTNPDESVAVISFEINKVYMSVSFDYETKEVRTVEMKVFLSHFE